MLNIKTDNKHKEGGQCGCAIDAGVCKDIKKESSEYDII